MPSNDPNRYETPELLTQYIRSQYGPFLRKEHHFESEPFYQRILEESLPYLSHTSSILDVGCATGRMVFEYAERTNSSTGIDSSKTFIDFCTTFRKTSLPENILFPFSDLALQNARFIHGDIYTYPFSKETFSFISCVNILDRVENPYELLDHLHTLLLKDGVLLLVTPYDWELSPANEYFHMNDMHACIDENKWHTEKEIDDLHYVIPTETAPHKRYTCHLLILKKLEKLSNRYHIPLTD